MLSTMSEEKPMGQVMAWMNYNPIMYSQGEIYYNKYMVWPL